MQQRSIAWLRSSLILMPVLFLFSLLYRIIIGLRNLLFDWHIFGVKKFSVPVISVGNISAGGTGKTPFTMELINMLYPGYKRIAVVSRGYGRQSRGLQLVSDGKGFIAGAETGGDEPVLIARRFPHCIVLVSEKRRLAIQRAIEQFQADLILLDDAFQHRWVNRDVDIVLISRTELNGPRNFLPAGDLREPLGNLKRANVIVLVNKEINTPEIDHTVLNEYYQGLIGSCHIKTECLVDSSLIPAGKPDQLIGQPVIAFSGIANPGSFKKILEQAGIQICQFLIFPDHHVYTQKDIHRIKAAARANKSRYLITTEKDLVKLPGEQFTGFSLLAVRIGLHIVSPVGLREKLEAFIDKTA